VFQIFVASVLAEIQNFRHRVDLTINMGQASLSPNSSHFYNAPKGGGLSNGDTNSP